MSEAIGRRDAQLAVDIYEDLELHRWRLLHPARVQLERMADEAARRADCLARLEHVLAQLSGPGITGKPGGD